VPHLIGVQRNRRMSVAFDYGLVFAALHASRLLAALSLHPPAKTITTQGKETASGAAVMSHPCDAPPIVQQERVPAQTFRRPERPKLVG
jgi:hypothetical protein